MKCLGLVVLSLAACCEAQSGPYLPSGWRPQGPAFLLPGEAPAEELQQPEVDAQPENTNFLREYGPPKLQELPSDQTEQPFNVVEIGGARSGKELDQDANAVDTPEVPEDAVASRNAAPEDETNSSPAEAASTPVEAASTPIEAASTPAEAASTPTEAASSTTESAPSTTESAPSTTESAPSTTESAPSTTDSAPSTTESAPSTTESAPSTTESASTTTESASTTTESATSTTEAASTTTDSSTTSASTTDSSAVTETAATTVRSDASTTEAASTTSSPSDSSASDSDASSSDSEEGSGEDTVSNRQGRLQNDDENERPKTAQASGKHELPAGFLEYGPPRKPGKPFAQYGPPVEDEPKRRRRFSPRLPRHSRVV